MGYGLELWTPPNKTLNFETLNKMVRYRLRIPYIERQCASTLEDMGVEWKKPISVQKDSFSLTVLLYFDMDWKILSYTQGLV